MTSARRFEVRFTPTARAAVLRISDALMDRAQTVEELDDALVFQEELEVEVEQRLSREPFLYEKAGDGSNVMLRELKLDTGYTVLYLIENPVVKVINVRHQREKDYR